MLNLFKNFGKGILYVLVLPILLVGLAIYGVAALFVFIFLAFKGLILFFTGRSLYEDLPEDIEAKKRIAAANGASLEIQSEVSSEQPAEQQTPKQENTIDNDPFYIPTYLNEGAKAEEEPKPVEDKPLENKPAERPLLEEQPAKEEAPKEEQIITKSSQNSAFSEISSEDEDDSDDSGIKIDFE